MEEFDSSIPSNSSQLQAVLNQYGYNGYEVFMMLMITGFTNLAIIPTIMIFYKQKMMFQFFISWFTFITSSMYHILDSLSGDRFFLETGEWHRLDNVGSIVGFMMFFGYVADIENLALETNLNYLGLFLTIIGQQANPWNLYFTVVPIFTWFLLYLGLKIKQRRLPYLNPTKVKSGSVFFFIAIYCFYNGLDEHKDYLRFYHGLWHLFVCCFSFQLYQSKLNGSDCYTIVDIWTKPKVKHSYYWPFDKELTE